MLLFSTSQTTARRFKIKLMDTTPPIASGDWFRSWRLDTRTVLGRELTLATNEETLYTLVLETETDRTSDQLAERFFDKYCALFSGELGYGGEEMFELGAFHRAFNRSVMGVMNYFFKMAAQHPRIGGRQGLESWLNDQPVGAVLRFPALELSIRLEDARRTLG